MHMLIPSTKEGVDDLLVLLGTSCSAKEIIIIAQEILGELQASINKDEEISTDQATSPTQLARMMSLYALG